MLEEDVEEGGLAVDLRGEEEIARGGGEFWVDETATDKTQRVPIHAAGELAREIGFQKGPGVIGVGEGRLDQLVVGLVARTLRHVGRELGTTRGVSTSGM